MRLLWIIASCAALVGCGVDGEPVQPEVQTQVSLSNAGVHLGGTVGLNRGPFSLRLGF